MPIVYAEPPEERRSKIGEMLRLIRARDTPFGPPELGKVTRMDMPHTVHFMSVPEVLDRQRLAEMPIVAWRFLLFGDDDMPLAAAQIPAGERRGEIELNVGPFVASTHEAVVSASSLEQVRQAHYQLRLLRVPALYVMALSLTTDREGDELIVPLHPIPREVRLAPHRPTTRDRFFHALAAPAQKAARRGDNRPKTGGGGLPGP